jgi:hypothetical protein
VLRNTRAQTALLRRAEDGLVAARDIIAELLALEEPRRRIGAMMSGLDIRYDLGDGHALLGRRMPDLDLTVDGRSTRVFALLHEARGLLLNFGDAGRIDIAPWAERVKPVDADTASAWELPVIGKIAAPEAVLVRPDGHVAWVGETNQQHGLREALTTWFGPAA